MAARSSTAPLTIPDSLLSAISERKTAVRSPIGTPAATASPVPTMDARMIYAIPYCGSAAVGFHTVPNSNSGTPTLL